MDPILTITTSDITGLLAYVGNLWTDLNLLVLLVIGLPLAFWVVRKAMSLVRTR